MAEFDPEKLKKRLDQLNEEQLATMEKLVEELLGQLEVAGRSPKRAEPKDAPPRSASAA